MKMLILCVNYNTPEHVRQYLSSINNALLRYSHNVSLEVIVANNSDVQIPIEFDTDLFTYT